MYGTIEVGDLTMELELDRDRDRDNGRDGGGKVAVEVEVAEMGGPGNGILTMLVTGNG
jgi:hypothetical protein